MGKRSVGFCVWLAFGMLVLAIMEPREIWIGLGIIGAIAFVAYLAIKYWAQKKRHEAYRHEPTLAELIAKNEPQRPLHRPEPRPSDMRRTPSGRALAMHLDRSSASETALQATTDANREHAEPLRDTPLPTLPLKNERINTPVDSNPSALLPLHTLQNSTLLPVGTPPNSQTAGLSDQLAEWNATRQAAIDVIHQRAQALRDKFPTTSPQASGLTKTPGLPFATPAPSSTTDALTPNSVRSSRDSMRVLQGSSVPERERMYSATEVTKSPLTHALPAAPANFVEGRWIPPGESIEVAGMNLPGGMLYVGGRLKALNGDTEPCLIIRQCSVARTGNYRLQQLGYWPSYAEASPNERRAYLNWLSEGRSHPDCDIGYVFLFFYGLERRVIADSRDDPAARDDWPAIIVELRRLLSIYGEKSGSFNRYASELLGWIELDGKSSQLYKQPIPDFPRTYALPPYLRLALGQAAVDRAPLPPRLALAWLRLSPGCYLRTAAIRCPSEFERLFVQRYQEALGSGLVLPKNRTKLKFVYQGASAGLHGTNVTMSFGDIPDVTALTAPIKKLMEIAEQCTDELGSYSRLVGKDPTAAIALEGLLLLPIILWPDTTQAKLRSLTTQMREGRLSLPLKELLDVLGGANQVVNRDRVQGLARALADTGIGLEPNVLGGAKAPCEQDTIVLFTQPLMDSDVGSRTEYKTAALTLQLASAVAQADGVFDDQEVAHLRTEIERWTHLTLAERRRLHAHLQWLKTSPMNLSRLKKKLEPLSIEVRETLATFMASLAQADGVVSPDEVKFLEKVYKALGVEPKRVFSDIHRAGSGDTPVSPVQTGKHGFRLDAERIAALQEDTIRVSALLSKIFTEEEANTATPPTPVPESELEKKAGSLLGLDEDHSALLRLLQSRPEWTRADLEDAAADMNLMLDGAMEQINEAAFETFDEPLFEGEDPISVNSQLLEKLEA